MRTVTFNGPQRALRSTATGDVLRRGVPTEVTNAEADRLVDAGANVTVDQDDDTDD